MRGQNKRMRGRGGRKQPNPLTRSYESNGPDMKVRGTASQISEKYQQLARDALASGDPVAAENYYQHAEHYLRIIATAQAANQANQQQQQANNEASEERDETRASEDGDGRNGQDRSNGEHRRSRNRGDNDRERRSDDAGVPDDQSSLPAFLRNGAALNGASESVAEDAGADEASGDTDTEREAPRAPRRPQRRTRRAPAEPDSVARTDGGDAAPEL